MAQLESSDSLIYITSSVLRSKGVSSYKVENAGHSTTFRTEEIYSLVYNPSRETLTFCWPNPLGEVQFSTYNKRRVRFIITSRPVPAIIAEAERILKSR